MAAPIHRIGQISVPLLLVGAVLLDLFVFSDAFVPFDEEVLGPHTEPGMIMALAALAWILLVVERFAGLPVFLVICGFSAVLTMLTSYSPVVVVCVGLAMVTSALPLRWSIVAALVAAATSITWVYAEQRAYDYTMDAAGLLVVWSTYLAFLTVGAGIGWWRQVSRRESERRQAEAAKAAIVGERRRVARELHDIVAHAVTLMVLQSSGARTVMASDPERAAEAMAVVENTGTQAMAELRRLLNVLRSDGDEGRHAPRPRGLDALPDLMASVQATGVRVSLQTVGEQRPLDASVDAAAYRVLSESLTNITKHSGAGTSAEVVLRWSPDHLDIDVSDDGRGAGSDRRLSTGNGLLGLTERIVLVGGDFEAHPGPSGGYLVHATLPLATVERVRSEV